MSVTPVQPEAASKRAIAAGPCTATIARSRSSIRAPSLFRSASQASTLSRVAALTTAR